MKKLLIILLFIFLSNQVNAQWSRFYLPHSQNEYVIALTSFGQNIIASLFYVGSSDNVFLSTNNGVNWMITSLQGKSTYCLLSDSTGIYAGTYDYGIYKSTNGGYNWFQCGLNSGWTVNALYNYNNIIFAGAAYYGTPSSYYKIYYSTNNGVQWNQVSQAIQQPVESFTSSGNVIFAGMGNDGVMRSTNNGLNWIYSGLNYNAVFSMTSIGNRVFATGYPYFHFTTDFGITWNDISSNINPGGVLSKNNTLIAGGYPGVYISTNYGFNWIQKSEGMTNITIRSFLISGNYLFAGSDSFSVWRRPLNEVVGINNGNSEIPDKFSLSQNYPNPFNPTTSIKYSVSSIQNVKLIVYNILGKEVETLVNEKQSPGTYEVNWDAASYPSGIYFYRLTAGEYLETRKMVLIK